jgi:hypothetical protein
MAGAALAFALHESLEFAESLLGLREVRVLAIFLRELPRLDLEALLQQQRDGEFGLDRSEILAFAFLERDRSRNEKRRKQNR